MEGAFTWEAMPEGVHLHLVEKCIMICIDLVPVSHPWCHAHVCHVFVSYVQRLSSSAQFLASQQLLPQASGPCLARLASMVTPARAHTLAVATRVTAEEAASLDAQLGNRGYDVWAREQRQRSRRCTSTSRPRWTSWRQEVAWRSLSSHSRRLLRGTMCQWAVPCRSQS